MPPAPVAREKVLDAFEALLVSEGERATTLEAVSAAAGVSKGGLLYHFGSKQALVEGLCARLRDMVDADVEAMRAAPEGPAAFYVRSSQWTGTPMDRAIVAVQRLAQGSYGDAVEELRSMRRRWFDVLVEAVEDPAVADAVMLLGDGLYYNAALDHGVDQGASAGAGGAVCSDVDRLVAVVDDLVRLRR